MPKLIAIALASLFAANIALAKEEAKAAPAAPSTPAAAAAGGDCEAKAVGKNGKPLAGAAKTAFMKKCEGEGKPAAASDCEGKAVSKDGKPLHGAAKGAFMKKCEADAKGK